MTVFDIVRCNRNYPIQSYLRIVADRILDVEAIATAIPSIAVLVNEESEFEPLAAALGAKLQDRNIKVAPCKDGSLPQGWLWPYRVQVARSD